MGCQYRFECEECGYAADVSGGQDAGFAVRTATMYCRTCRELRDVTVQSVTADPVRGVEEAEDDDGGQCPRCGGIDLIAWQEGDPCPRCQGRVEKGGLILLWD